MQRTNYIKFLIIVLFALFCNTGFSQLSKTHYIPPLTNSGFGNANPEDQYIYLSTPSNTDVAYTIIPVGQPITNYITGTVSNTNPQEIAIGNGYGQLFVPSNQTSVVINNKGYIIEAEGTIYVSVRMNAGGAQAGALVSKGLSALGTIFRVGAYTNANPQDNYLNFVSVMATEDNTQVTFDNLPAGLIIKNYTGTTPINITLNKGESYTIGTNCLDSVINRDGLIGCLVNSDKPIVVNCGSTNGSFGNGGGRDYGIDQIADLSKVGTEYIFVKGDGDNDWENILIVAHTDNTTISLNGNAPITTINAGQHYVIEGNNYNANGNMYVETSQPIFAYQGVGGLGNNGSPSEANQGLFFVPPLSCEARGNLDNIAQIENIGFTNYQGGITIVTKVGAVISINSSTTGNINPGAASPVTGKPDYITYKIKGITGNISVASSDELYCAYFNYSGAATSGSFYSGFPSKPEINFDAVFVTLGNCIPNVSLSAANTQSFGSFKWLFDDGTGSGFEDLLITASSITPTLPGKYKLAGIIACTGEELTSVEVPVSICPDDSDNDGIIDNLDIDHDNDGILNCTESNGNVIINLLDTNLPQLVFQDNSTDTSITSASLTQNNSHGNTTNTLSGTTVGDFTSTVQPATSGESDYTLLFNEPIDLKFEENSSVVHTSTIGEFFIAKILPSNKNITLLDPDNRLLVDSNFDGLFETGITQISGSEIHFKINPTPSGNTPFTFFGNKVEAFSFIHRLANTTTASTFSGIVSLTCYKLDTDLDGIENSWDLDSDNDGIPDSIENGGTLVTLSGMDVDTNGLDDVFDINASPLDSDNDNVYDFYDLDSDNDGITDLIETGQLGTLSDTDLNGIVDGSNFGVNGWADTAETSPDSNLIGYVVNDFDNDTIFSYIDSDSDGDTCSDVIEAGFSDANGDDLLGDNVVTTDASGLVNNAIDGYTIPNVNYLTTAIIIIDTEPVDTEICEFSNTILSLASTTYDTIQWEISTDGINWNPLIDDTTYSDTQTNSLNISNTPLTFDTYQYRAFLNLNGNSCGFYSDEVELTVIPLPIANTAQTIRQCDDDNNGIVEFNLTSQNSFINTTPGMTITYHPTFADAESGSTGVVLTSPYESGNTTIYARVENDLNTTCYDISNFDLEVYESPFSTDASLMTPLQECDDTSIGTDTDDFKTFDLTQKETEILNGQSATDFTLSYFTDASGDPSVEILNPSSYPKTTTGNQTIYVRVSNTLYNVCTYDTFFEIETFELPVVNNPSLYKQCDDVSNDQIAFFNLTLETIKEEIAPNYIVESLTFTYYNDQSVAEMDGIPITNPSNYLADLNFLTEIIWIRIENLNGCFRVVPITLKINPSDAALGLYSPSSIYQCDDGLDERDGVSTFDMSNIRDYITNTIFSTFNVTAHFYESQLDAEIETNEIQDISNHQNTISPNSQDIWVRVKSDLGNNCLGLKEFQNLLIVEALPIANPVIISAVCDNDTDITNGFLFDTTNLEADILNGQSLADVSITYFNSIGNPLTDFDGNPITSPFPSIFLSTSQIITARIINNTTQDPDGACDDQTDIEFKINASPVAHPVTTNTSVCDDESNDGFHNFDLSTIRNEILLGQAMDIFFDYIDENGNLVIDSPTLPNTLESENQTISVEVKNPLNTTCTVTSSISLIVNPLPEFSVDTPQIVCSSDPTFTVVLDAFEDNPSEIHTYEWLWTSLDGASTNQFISNDPTITVSIPGTYAVTLTKTDGTGCSRTRDVFVNASELATIEQKDLTVVDISDNNNITIQTSTLGQGDYEFALEDATSTLQDEAFFDYQDESFFENVKAGFHKLYVRDKDGCGTTFIAVSVIGYAKFFTPNGDGTNDTWQIKGIGSGFQSNSDIYIFDRYGKLLKQLDPLGIGWDGTFNGALLSTDDYWFKVLLQDGRTFMGHFTLKR
jgi:gliding motility-associated-like protein